MSRALWDDARKSHGGLVNMRLLKAILYELQPIDIMHSEISISSIGDFINEQITRIHNGVGFLSLKIPTVVGFVRHRSMKEWMILAGCILYWKTLVFLHESLDAGPSILIVTALVAIFTVGLGDNDGANHENGERMSAYSVFNRGFRNIMGGVDANALVNQHVGGGFFANNLDDNAGRDQNGDDGRNRQRLRLQQQLGQRQRQPPDLQDQGANPQDQQPPNRARMSNKKNRRKRNIEQRREMQRQRDAAAAMGFVGADDDNGHINLNLLQQDREAMNRLLDHDVHNEDNDV